MLSTCLSQSATGYEVTQVAIKQTKRAYFRYLIERNNILYFRISVPYSLQSVLNKKEIRYSLRTSYLKDARLRSLFLASRIKRIFVYAKKAISMNIEIDRDKINKLLHCAFDQSLHDIDIHIHSEMGGEELKTKADIESYLSTQAEYIESNIYSDKVSGVGITNFDAVRKFALGCPTDDGMSIDSIAGYIFNAIPSTQREEFSELIYQIARMIQKESTFSVFKQSAYIQCELDKLSGDFANIEATAYRQSINKLRGLFDYAKAHQEIDKTYPRKDNAMSNSNIELEALKHIACMLGNIKQNIQPDNTRNISTQRVDTEQRAKSPTLGEAIANYKQTITATQWKESYSTATGYLLEYFGSGILLSDITGDMIAKYAWNFMNFPKGRDSNEDYKDKPIKYFSTIEIPSEHRLKHGTVNGYLEKVVTLFKTTSIQKHFKPDEYVLQHLTEAKKKIVSTLKKEQGGGKSGVKPFNEGDLSKLFNTTTFGKLLDSNSELAWAMLIATYTGMRSGEIAELKPSDIKTTPDAPLDNKSGAEYRDGITYIDLSYSDVKNESSQRLIPLNTFLLHELRLMDFFESRRNSELIFPSFVNKFGDKDDAISKSFTKYRRSVNVGRNINSDRFGIDNKVLHSFRHTFKHRCKMLNLRADLLNEYVGHGKLKEQGQPTYNHELGIDSLFDNIAESLDFHAWIPEIGALVDTMKKVKL